MQIVSWNVNGIRSVLKKGATEAVRELNADILCFQEIKTCPATNPVDEFPEFAYKTFHTGTKRGYSGTSVFSKQKPLSITYDLPYSSHDHFLEGRVITAEFDQFFVVNVYVPNAKADLSRLEYRYQYWDIDFRKHLQYLAKEKPVIAVGDFNVAHEEIDLARPGPNRGEAGFTNEERSRFTELLDAGFVDSFRFLYPNITDRYTWWSYRARARANNIGWRIDYVIVSEAIKHNLTSATIHDDILGSDHCPVSIRINI